MKTYQDEPWSTLQWKAYLTDWEQSRSSLRDMRHRVAGAEHLAEEVFMRLFTGNGKPKAAPPESTWIRKIHGQLHEDADFRALCQRSHADRLAAGDATLQVVGAIVDKLDRTPDVPDPAALRQKVKDAKQHLENLKAQGASEEELRHANDAKDKMVEKGKSAVQQLAKWQAAQDENAVDVRAAINNGLTQAQEAADRAKDVDGLFGWGDGDGSPEGIDPDVKAAMAKAVRESPKLRKLAQMIGRMRIAAREAQKSKPDFGPVDIVGIEQGNDIGRALPVELGMLGCPATRLYVERRFVESQLMQWDLKDATPKEKGPIICAVDESGSMHGANDLWAKAVAGALLGIARDQKRDFALVHFSNKVERVDYFPALDAIDPSKVLDALAYFATGGTSFEAPLDEARRLILSSSTWEQADITLITDGCASVSENWRTKWTTDRDEHGFKCQGVHIGAPGGVPGASLSQLCDEVHGITDLTGDESVTSALFSI